MKNRMTLFFAEKSINEMKYFYITFIISTTLYRCSSIQEISANKEDEIILASSSRSCKVIGEHARWKIGYGSFPLYIRNSDNLFPSSTKAYRVRESSKWYDVLISVVLGFSLTISKDTLVVEECPLPISLENKIAKSLDSDNELFQKLLQESIDNQLSVKQKEFDEVVEATLSQYEQKLKIRNDLPTIWLKGGKIFQGKILRQDAEGIEIEDAAGTKKTISKDQILKIKMR
ncbi:LIC_13076 family protein [Leptospira sp. GIMC2001]|uniref:LIC_13076 family protein n=1 Tax=Leptospira sp. GIMC2001 TaxID=1513297 RepID=UPI002349802C|nr:hypothetical protein [Leptospira sp. GIMC2001]WCL48789.1 hypothetical protein O4O04_15985 [Leptospira sp. GIMC2001]